jgi:hypothetical protein
MVSTKSNHGLQLEEFIKFRKSLPNHYAKKLTNILPLENPGLQSQSKRSNTMNINEVQIIADVNKTYTSTSAINFQNQLALLVSTFNNDLERIKSMYVDYNDYSKSEKETADYAKLTESYNQKMNSIGTSINTAIENLGIQIQAKQYLFKSRDAVAHYTAVASAQNLFALTLNDVVLRAKTVYQPETYFKFKDIDFYSALIALEQKRGNKSLEDIASTIKALKTFTQLIGTKPLIVETLELERLGLEVIRAANIQEALNKTNLKMAIGLQMMFDDRKWMQQLRDIE